MQTQGTIYQNDNPNNEVIHADESDDQGQVVQQKIKEVEKIANNSGVDISREVNKIEEKLSNDMTIENVSQSQKSQQDNETVFAVGNRKVKEGVMNLTRVPKNLKRSIGIELNQKRASDLENSETEGDLSVEDHVSNSDTEKFAKVYQGSKIVLAKAKNVFPFEFFTDEIVVHEHTVDLIYGLFFFSSTKVTIALSDINHVVLNSGILFSSLSIEVSGFEQNPDPINHLWRHEAEHVKKIISGLIIARKEGIDIKGLDAHKLLNKIEVIGDSTKV